MNHNAGNVGTGSGTETYAEVKETVVVSVDLSTVTYAEQIARYFFDDVSDFLQKTGINFATYLQLPANSDYPTELEELMEMLYDDLAHMLRDHLITGFHLLLSEPKPDPSMNNAYPLRYHALYNIYLPQRTLNPLPPDEEATIRGGRLAPPDKVLFRDARFDMLVDWDPAATDARMHKVRRPDYWFNWVPESARFDETRLVAYREGRFESGHARVGRIESAAHNLHAR